MSSYQPLGLWSSGLKQGELSSREPWFRMPGTSPYELNANVSLDGGPAWGPKSSIYRQRMSRQSVSRGTKYAAGAVLALVLALLIWYFFIRKAESGEPGEYYF